MASSNLLNYIIMAAHLNIKQVTAPITELFCLLERQYSSIWPRDRCEAYHNLFKDLIALASYLSHFLLSP